jgi:cytochrome c oxidase assembly factor CtaG
MSITGPLTVWLIHGITVWGWHLPVLYEATLRSEFVHALQHTSFLGTALLFWWALIYGRFGRMSYGVSVVYVFATALHTSILGALLTFAQHIWYPIYDGRTLAWSLTPIEDQQLGGLIMWIPGGLVFIAVGLGLFAAWIGESERRVQFTSLESLAYRSPDGRSDAA